tara:strand:- start:5288 stop:6664 length:1377 start_codon:yes stop_codon:yes gene_type:complete
MPFNNYSPTYVFKGQVQSDTAPSNNNDLVRKQDVSGLSFISSIASGSSSYLSVSGGELSVSSLLISDVHVDNSQSSLANFISNESSTAANLKKGDFLVLTAATGGAETYIVSGADGSNASNYTEVESGLTSAEIVAKLSAGAGINISAGGQISSTITQYTDSNARAALSGGAGISYNNSTGQISSSITQYTDANARAALSAGTGISYNSSTGVITSSITQYTDALARGAFSYGKGIDISISGQLSLDFTEFDTDDLVEGSNKLFYTDARSRAAVSAGTGLTYNSSTGQFACSITQYTDSNARSALSAGAGIAYNSSTGAISSTITQYTDSNARSALSAGVGLNYNSGTGQFSSTITQYTDANARASISAPAGSGLQYNSTNGEINVDNGFFRATFTNQSLTANVAKTINHDLGEKLVHVSVYDSNDDLVHVQVSLTDNDNLTITSSDALTGVSVVVSI